MVKICSDLENKETRNDEQYKDGVEFKYHAFRGYGERKEWMIKEAFHRVFGEEQGLELLTESKVNIT